MGVLFVQFDLAGGDTAERFYEALEGVFLHEGVDDVIEEVIWCSRGHADSGFSEGVPGCFGLLERLAGAGVCG